MPSGDIPAPNPALLKWVAVALHAGHGRLPLQIVWCFALGRQRLEDLPADFTMLCSGGVESQSAFKVPAISRRVVLDTALNARDASSRTRRHHSLICPCTAACRYVMEASTPSTA